ncbi:DUF1285 domain-containing protein [Marinibactrum halimedae]|uniref:DUF1285 domain-containing protein n=1 Tax=Marinibactrum halimedae TaxID=1444977 RepID=A0AA37TB15_9GAMM|nr:DUF1285 domain-containing protein [Marinibactrum halimedae]MCD9459469.1 DUF1285 domain-containing protein [Marinibactrum halimedae]GLS28123.1 hypothetical protein GCM10007877_38420 [Marinibactrum halimedae]
MKLDDLSQHILHIQQKREQELPPVHLWNPPLSGVMDLVIKTNGEWIHEGDKIEREKLIQLFSRVLKREGDHYYLITPVEKWQISVESHPFYFNKLVENEPNVFTVEGLQNYAVTISEQNPLWVEGTDDFPLPVIRVRHNLNGVLNRNVYYELCDRAIQNKAGRYGIVSAGMFFSLEVNSESLQSI